MVAAVIVQAAYPVAAPRLPPHPPRPHPNPRWSTSAVGNRAERRRTPAPTWPTTSEPNTPRSRSRKAGRSLCVCGTAARSTTHPPCLPPGFPSMCWRTAVISRSVACSLDATRAIGLRKVWWGTVNHISMLPSRTHNRERQRARRRVQAKLLRGKGWELEEDCPWVRISDCHTINFADWNGLKAFFLNDPFLLLIHVLTKYKKCKSFYEPYHFLQLPFHPFKELDC